MVDTPLALVPEDQYHPWAYDVNPLVRLLRGVTTGGLILRGDLGTRRDLTSPNTELTGRYTIEAQSLASGGLHAAFPLSATSVTATPTVANSAVIINDTGLVLGSSAGIRLDLETIRVYESGRVDYAQLTSLNGEMLLTGSGASAGAMSMDGSLTVKSGSAIKVNNATNTAVGQLAADASGNLTVGGTTSNLYINGDLRLSSTGKLIEGDFSNGTLANRVFLKTTTANSGTAVGALPNGSSTQSGFQAYANATPASAAVVAELRATATAMQLRADSPSASYQKMEFYTNNTLALTLTTGQLLQAVGAIFPSNQTLYFLSVPFSNQVVASSGTLSLGTSFAAILVLNESTGAMTIAGLEGGANTVIALAATTTGFVINSDTGTSIAIYHDGSVYRVKNRTAGDQTLSILQFGR